MHWKWSHLKEKAHVSAHHRHSVLTCFEMTSCPVYSHLFFLSILPTSTIIYSLFGKAGKIYY